MMRSKMRMRRSINSSSCAFHSPAEKGRSTIGRISAVITALICWYRLSILSKWRNTVRSPTPARAATASALGATWPAPTSSSIARTIRSRLASLRCRRPSVCSRVGVSIFIVLLQQWRAFPFESPGKSAAQSGKTACTIEDRIDALLVGGRGVFLAQRAERFGVILLRLLGPRAARQLDAEFLAPVRNCCRVGYRPRHEQPAALPLQQRPPRWLETRPGLELTFRSRPQHSMDPRQDIRCARFDERTGRGIGPGAEKLTPHREVDEGGARTEEIRAVRQVRVEDSDSLAEGIFNLGRGLCAGADEPDSPYHPLTHLRDRGCKRLLVRP